MEHSILGASSMQRWEKDHCPGSVAACKNWPRTTSGAAKEGTEAHFVAEHLLLSGRSVKDLPDGVAAFPGREFVTWEMFGYVQGYVDYVRSFVDQARSAGVTGPCLTVEQKFKLSWLHYLLFGTNDASVVIPNNVLHVFDLKYGVGVQVEAEGNPQLMYYGLGALGPDNPNKVTKVVFHIYQPRGFHPAGPIRTWELSVEELYNWGRDYLSPSASLASSPNAPLKAGWWCKKSFCPGKDNGCPGLTTDIALSGGQDAGAVIVQGQTNINLPSLENMTPEQLIRAHQFAGLMKDWSEGIGNFIRARVQAGDKGFEQHYKLVPRKSNRKYKNEKNVVDEFHMFYGDEIYEPEKKRKLKSPAQLEKLVGKKELKSHWMKPDAGITLAPITDTRKAVTAGASDFDGVPIQGGK